MALTDIISSTSATAFARGNIGTLTDINAKGANELQTPLITPGGGGGGEHSYIFF